MLFSATLAAYLSAFANGSDVKENEPLENQHSEIKTPTETKNGVEGKAVLEEHSDAADSSPTTTLLSESKFGGSDPEKFPFQTTENGAIYSLTKGIRLSDFNGNLLAKPVPVFTNKQGDLTFEGNGFSLLFSNNMGPTAGLAVKNPYTEAPSDNAIGAVAAVIPVATQADQSSSKKTTFSGFSSLGFINNQVTLKSATTPAEPAVTMASTTDTEDPASIIHVEDLTFQGNGDIIFKENISPGSGGAISATAKLNVTANTGTISFEGNVSTGITPPPSGSTDGANGAGSESLASRSASLSTSITNEVTNRDTLKFATSKVAAAAPTPSTTSSPNSTQAGNGGAIAFGVTKESPAEEAQQESEEETPSPGLFGANSSSINFSQNIAHGKGGAIYVEKGPFSFENNLGPITFVNNRASSGGAIYTQDSLSFSGNRDIIFSGNIASSSTMSEGNGGAVCFKENSILSEAVKQLDVSPPTKSVSFSKNGSIVFQRNIASGNGGAISAKTLSFTDNGPIFFLNNTANQGGAIYVDNQGTLTLSADKGNIIFFGNTSSTPKVVSETQLTLDNQENSKHCRNAIYLDAGSTFNLRALAGNAICFYDPIVVKKANGGLQAVTVLPTLQVLSEKTHSSNSSLVINADPVSEEEVEKANLKTPKALQISPVSHPLSGSHCKILSIAPNTETDLTEEDVSVHPQNVITKNSEEIPTVRALTEEAPAPDYSGTIVFSGKGLSEEEKANVNNLTSIIEQDVTLNKGILILEQGAILKVNKFTQTSGSHLVMDLTSQIIATDTTNGCITLQDLSINFDGISESSSGATLKCEQPLAREQSISLPTAITILDPKGSLYENHSLSSNHDFTVLNINPESLAPNQRNITKFEGAISSPYGYQGTWSISTGENERASTPIKAKWNYTGYIPSPERTPYLSVSSLWDSHLDSRAVRRAITTSSSAGRFDLVDDGFGHRTWASGLGVFFHQDSRKDQKSFRHLAGGYAAGLSIKAMNGSIVTFGWGQLFGKSKDYLISDNKELASVAAMNLQHRAYLSNRSQPVLSITGSYGRTDNRLVTKSPVFGELKGSWRNLSLGASAELKDFAVLASKHLLFSPFLKTDVTYARGGSTTESGTEGRKYTLEPLYNVSVIPGVTALRRTKCIEEGEEVSELDVSISYVADIYRKNPSGTATLLANNHTWSVNVSNLSKHALMVQADSKTRLSPRWWVMANYAFELRSSSRSHNVYAGTKISF